MRALALVCVLATPGCVIALQTEQNAPGIVDLAAAPPALRASQHEGDPLRPPARYEVDPGADPGMRGTAITASTYGAYGGEVTNGRNGIATLGISVGASRFETPRSRGYAKEAIAQKLVVRPVVGWDAVRAERTETRAGPVWVEGQAVYRFGEDLGYLRAGLAAAYDPVPQRIGPQARLCITPTPVLFDFCARGAWFVDHRSRSASSSSSRRSSCQPTPADDHRGRGGDSANETRVRVTRRPFDGSCAQVQRGARLLRQHLVGAHVPDGIIGDRCGIEGAARKPGFDAVAGRSLNVFAARRNLGCMTRAGPSRRRA